MKDAVLTAIEGVRLTFPGTHLVVEPDGQGGAYVRVEHVELSPSFEPQQSWLGGHLPASLPYADVYPVFLRGDLRRSNGVAFQPPITSGHTFMGLSATQISRRSNARNPDVETAAMKLLKVLSWVNSQ